jgi:leucyl aminopeptidase (aminopeptidase T)
MPIVDPSAAAMAGLDTLIHDYARVAPGDHAIIAYWHECTAAAAWLEAGLSLAGASTEVHRLASSDDAGFAALIEPIVAQAAQRKSPVHLFVGENQSLSFTHILRRFAARHDIAIWRLMNFTPELFELGLQQSPEAIKAVNAALLERLMRKHEITILTGDPAGEAHRLTAGIDPDAFQWISNYGRPGRGELIALPAGEINTYPAALDGEFYADGAIHANIPLPFDVRLARHPVLLKIRDRAVHDFACADVHLSRALDTVFSNALCRRVGELGFGTNLGVTRFTTGNTHINERFPAVHIGLGEHTQPGRVHYEAPIHIDMISADSRVETRDGRPPVTMSRLAELAGRAVAHPEGTRGEDLEHVA